MAKQYIRQFLIVPMAVALGLAGTPALRIAWAQEYGNANRGAALALNICATCHGVRKGEASANPLAPPFAAIADVRGMSAMALNVALQSSHRNMPNIVLDAQERADLSAYILSMKSK